MRRLISGESASNGSELKREFGMLGCKLKKRGYVKFDLRKRKRPKVAILRGNGVRVSLKTFSATVDRTSVILGEESSALPVSAGEIGSKYEDVSHLRFRERDCDE